jgi:YD repeat-containing protein
MQGAYKALLIILGLLATTDVLAVDKADCMALFRATGAKPGTQMCQLDASLYDVNLGNYWCGVHIPEYCGEVPRKNQCTSVGHPIDSSNGNKHLTERDYGGVGAFPLVVERYYNSLATFAPDPRTGSGWRMNYLRRIDKGGSSTAFVTRANGLVLYYSASGGAWVADADIKDKLVEQKNAAGKTTGWQFQNADDDTVESYDANGLLTRMVARNGQVQTLGYSTASTPSGMAPGPNYLIRVTDHFGRQLNFTWNSDGTLATFSDPQGNVYRYGYDNQKRLITVIYPAEGAGQPKRTYLYNEPEHTSGSSDYTLLTGIIDENNVRLAIYDYDAEGRGIGTQYAGGADKYTLQYGVGATAITDPLGSVRTYRFSKIFGALRMAGVDQPGGAGCAAASNSVRYDANGNVRSRTDFNGVTTTYAYDLARNLETSRTEAAGTPLARTISTDWHPAFRVPAHVAEPNRLTTYSYFANGELQAKTVQATDDPTGERGLNASLVGMPRTWRYTYNAAGQILTATGPRTDVADITTYRYDDPSGNLLTVTDAVGHVTRLSDYDAHGRAGKIVEPNGVAVTLAYTPRGWLASRTETAGVVSRQTRYEYDNAGLFKKVTLPDTSILNYGYDEAHRLTDVSDAMGNVIHYVLDNMGNRVEETVQDASGTLARKTTRIYDELNRVKEVTGGRQ